MKILFALLVVLLSNGVTGQIPDYLGNDPSWHCFNVSGHPQVSQSIQYTDYNLFLNGDTTINGIAYKKVYSKGVFWQNGVNGGVSIMPSNFWNPAMIDGEALFVRQVNRSYHFYHVGSGTDSLLMDYDYQVGDVPRGHITNTLNSSDTIVAIDSVMVGTNYRKVFYLDASLERRIIEGIGCYAGTLPENCGAAFNVLNVMDDCFEGGHYFYCYGEQGTGLFPTVQTAACNLALDLSEKNIESIQVSPIPANAVLVVTSDRELQSDFKVVSLSGQDVSSNVFLSSWELNSLELDVSILESGVYILFLNGSRVRFVKA